MEMVQMEMEMEMEIEQKLKVLTETLKRCQQRQEAPSVWIMEVGRCLKSLGMGMPSPELGELLVSHLCSFHNPSLWKFLHQALSGSSRLISPLHLLSLLSSRVIPCRSSQPVAYRLFLELVSRYSFSLDPVPQHASTDKIISSVDAALHLSQTFGFRVLHLGHLLVLCFFSLLVALIDATCNDLGLLINSPDQTSGLLGNAHHQGMDIDPKDNRAVGKDGHLELLKKANSIVTLEVLAKLTESRKAMVLLRLVHLNMPEKFNALLKRLSFLEANKLSSSNIIPANQLLGRLSTNIHKVCCFEYHSNKRQLSWMLINARTFNPMCCEFAQSACWVPFDIYMENIMDGKQLLTRSAVVMLAETIKSLQVFNRARWQETFIALWLSALRLVQRESDPLEGPIPHLESRLSILLTIVPLAIANILEDEPKIGFSSVKEAVASGYTEAGCEHLIGGKGQSVRKHGLISSLQVLGLFSALLHPPASVVCAANVAALRAASFLSNSKNSDSLGYGSDTHIKAGGNLRHLIVESCIARNLIDTSAYFWPGYVSGTVISSDLSPIQKSPWLTFMEGAPLSMSLVNLLLLTPAPSLAEIEKLYHMALIGSAEEKSAAAKVLCGTSLSRGWNIQEHVVHYVVKLLSPPIPSTHTGQMSHLVDYIPMLSGILSGASSVDTVHVLSLHGMIPEIAASLMPLCEVFGSLIPTSSVKLSTEDAPSIYMIFSSAFLFLLRLWKFYRPPLDQGLSGGEALGGELSLEYLLMLRNSHIASPNSTAVDKNDDLVQHECTPDNPIYIDFYPKLRGWYCQNKSCIASPLSALPTGNPVNEVADKILYMIYSKVTKSGSLLGNSSTQTSNSLGGSPLNAGEVSYQRPILPAWEVLEAIPFVLEAILTACAHGRLSSRDLTTGLRDLIDFLPASLGTIISYFSAEVSRGTWSTVSMNGIDWPSPAAILSSVESEMKEILAGVGVDFVDCSSGLSPVLPLPMAALVSLTITFKLNKSLEYIHAVVGPALENCASGCPWPSVSIIGSLWAQKVRRWHHFIVVSCARSVFKKNKEAVTELLRSCFSSFLGLGSGTTSLLNNEGSVSGLLGRIIAVPGACPSLAPGFLYLRSYRTIHNVQHVKDVIVGLVLEYASKALLECASTKSSQMSLLLAAAKAREVGVLGASLLWVSGGINLVQELYQETMPTWLLTSREERDSKGSCFSRVLEGYAMAYMIVLSGSFVWGADARSPSTSPALSRRTRIVGTHMEFLVKVLEEKISLGCHPATWKAYVCCLLGLVVSFAPAWVQEVKLETLKKLASGLKGWHEYELAISLLERGGTGTIGSVAELVNELC